MTIQPIDPDGVLRISGALDIREAEAFREALTQWLKQYPALEIDLSAVDGCDATALQLLLAARKSAEGRSQSFRITASSPSVAEACAELGVSLD